MEAQQPRRLLRLPDIIGDRKTGKPARIPVSARTWWSGVRAGRYPRGIKVAPNVTAWDSTAIDKLIDDLVKAESPTNNSHIGTDQCRTPNVDPVARRASMREQLKAKRGLSR